MYQKRLKIKGAIEEYKEALAGLGVKVEGAVLYGSFAKGNQRKDSDIDLIIISNDFKKMNLRQRLEVLGIAAVRIMKPIEAKGYIPEEVSVTSSASFLKEILEAGIGCNGGIGKEYNNDQCPMTNAFCHL